MTSVYQELKDVKDVFTNLVEKVGTMEEDIIIKRKKLVEHENTIMKLNSTVTSMTNKINELQEQKIELLKKQDDLERELKNKKLGEMVTGDDGVKGSNLYKETLKALKLTGDKFTD